MSKEPTTLHPGQYVILDFDYLSEYPQCHPEFRFNPPHGSGGYDVQNHETRGNIGSVICDYGRLCVMSLHELRKLPIDGILGHIICNNGFYFEVNAPTIIKRTPERDIKIGSSVIINLSDPEHPTNRYWREHHLKKTDKVTLRLTAFVMVAADCKGKVFSWDMIENQTFVNIP